MKGAQTPCLGLQSTPAQPVPSDSKYLTILNLWQVDQRPSGSGPRPTWLQGLCLFLPCAPIPVPALPAGGKAFKKIPVINVVSLVVSHCEGRGGGLIFLTRLA